MDYEQIEDYKLFENGKTKIHLRAPTVGDYRYFAGLDEHLEESITTQYLNRMQIAELYDDGKIRDSLQWTGEDRRTCLFWIYMNTRERTVLTQSYDCKHCSERHARQIDAVDLVQYLIDTDHSMTEKIQVAGVKKGYIQPLRGDAMEFIEALRNERDMFEEDTPEWCLAHTDLRLYETAWSIKFQDDDPSKTRDEQAKARFDYLLTLNPEKQYKPLAAQVRKSLSEMRHGLMSEYHEGEIRLVTPPHECPNANQNRKEGDELVETILLMPFHYNEFLPTV